MDHGSNADPSTLALEQRPRRSKRPRREWALILALHCDRPLEPPQRVSLDGVQQISIGRGKRRNIVREGATLDFRVDDPWMSTGHAALELKFGTWTITDAGSLNGILVNGERVDSAVLARGDIVVLGRTVFRLTRGRPAKDLGPAPAPGLATMIPELADQIDRLARIAASDVSVVIRGATGTGKELAARAVHDLSGREGNFVAVNCGALPETLVESQLFGHVRGAFSGAGEDREGLVRRAEGGTLFLDEIGDLRPPSQAALLRVLQEGEVVPVGASAPVAVDVRVVCATHRDLDDLVESGGFRGDLLARLSGFTLSLPPLRERKDDLGMLIGDLLRTGGGDPERIALHPGAVCALFEYDFPHNIRELEKILSAATVLAGQDPIGLEHFPQRVRRPAPARAGTVPLHDRRRAHIAEMLRKHQGNVSAVARDMGKARMQIQRWIKRYELDPDRHR